MNVRTMKHGWDRALLSAVVFVGFTGVAEAQKLSLTPVVGVYIPTSELVKAASGQKFKQEVSISVGGRVALWFGRRLGLEVAGDYAPSELKFSAMGGSNTASANIISGSSRLIYFVIPSTSMLSLRVSAGASGVRRSGDAYPSDETDVGGVLGAILGFRLGPINLQLTADDYIYSATFTGSTQISSKLQHDVHLGVGYGAGF
ncbi:MAG: hypothetical protein ABI836_10460 [Gemmatimonadota bacterium]